MKIVHFVAVAFLLFGLTSCVAKKKYVELENQRKACEERAEDLSQQLTAANGKITDLNAASAKLNSELVEVRAAKIQLEQQSADLQKQLTELSSETLSEKQKMDAAMKKKLAELEKREQAIEELQQAIAAKDKAMRDVLTNIQQAMQQYNSDELTVELRDGKVYVAISDKLLFKSGSAKVDAGGKDALAMLAGVLTKHPELDIIVEGHTDNVPIKTDRFADNWDLSVVRATSVVRILTQEYGVEATQATAAGRGEYFPKQPNTSPEGKAANRRTEIIIAPKLDQIMKLLNK